MKRKFSSHSEVCHVWAQQSQSEGEASRIFFRGRVIYSYGYHFPAGIFLNRDTVAINSDSYSVSTGKHMGYVRRAVSHKHTIYVPTVIMKVLEGFSPDDGNTSRRKELLEVSSRYVQAAIVEAGEIASNPRRRPNTRAVAIGNAEHQYSECAEVLAIYKLKFPVAVTRMLDVLKTDAGKIAAANQKAIAADKAKRAKAQAAEQKRREAKAAEALPLWLAGQDDYEHRNALFNARVTALRITASGDNVETSQGAVFPLAHGLKALPVIRAIVASGKPWQRNGKTIHLGHYQIDSIADGVIVAGCHTIPVTEVERLAATIAA